MLTCFLLSLASAGAQWAEDDGGGMAWQTGVSGNDERHGWFACCATVKDRYIVTQNPTASAGSGYSNSFQSRCRLLRHRAVRYKTWWNSFKASCIRTLLVATGVPYQIQATIPCRFSWLEFNRTVCSVYDEYSNNVFHCADSRYYGWTIASVPVVTCR